MGFIYKIEINNETYVGSTKNKYLCNRQYTHNYNMKNNNISIFYKDPIILNPLSYMFIFPSFSTIKDIGLIGFTSG